jgi:hypothetical protein
MNDCFRDDRYPSIQTPNLLFEGIPYKNLHIFNIKACRNNTIINLTDFEGEFTKSNINIYIYFHIYLIIFFKRI